MEMGRLRKFDLDIDLSRQIYKGSIITELKVSP